MRAKLSEEESLSNNRAREYLTLEINLIRDGTTYILRDSIYNLALQKPKTEILNKKFLLLWSWKDCGIHFQTR